MICSAHNSNQREQHDSRRWNPNAMAETTCKLTLLLIAELPLSTVTIMPSTVNRNPKGSGPQLNSAATSRSCNVFLRIPVPGTPHPRVLQQKFSLWMHVPVSRLNKTHLSSCYCISTLQGVALQYVGKLWCLLKPESLSDWRGPDS